MAVLRHLRRAGREIQAQAQQSRTAAAAKLRHLPGGRSRQGGKAFRREGRQQQGVRAETVAVLRLVQAPGEEGTGGRDGGIVHGRTVVMAACWRGGGRCGDAAVRPVATDMAFAGRLPVTFRETWKSFPT